MAHYEITNHLGTGGMGEVYQATDTKLGCSVAAKFLPAAFSADADRLSRFRREAQVLASLNHPNIAQIYGIEESNESRCIVMELVRARRMDPRATGDLDIWVEPSVENAGRVVRALKDFGVPLDGVSESDFVKPGVTFQIGVAPLRIDILIRGFPLTVRPLRRVVAEGAPSQAISRPWGSMSNPLAALLCSR